MRTSLIAALDDERGIGKNNMIPWRLPGEQQLFKRLTMGHPIIMGRKTFESLGRVLPGRTNIVVTRDAGYAAPEGAVVTTSLEEAIAEAKKHDTEEIFIIGGSALYEAGLDIADRLYLTLVEGTHEADTFFPPYEEQFSRVSEEPPVEENGERYRFTTHERREREG